MLGKPITIYLVGKDREATPNRSLARGFPLTLLPPIPTGVKARAQEVLGGRLARVGSLRLMLPAGNVAAWGFRRNASTKLF